MSMSVEAQIEFCRAVIRTTKSNKCRRNYLTRLKELKKELKNANRTNTNCVWNSSSSVII